MVREGEVVVNQMAGCHVTIVVCGCGLLQYMGIVAPCIPRPGYPLLASEGAYTNVPYFLKFRSQKQLPSVLEPRPVFCI